MASRNFLDQPRSPKLWSNWSGEVIGTPRQLVPPDSRQALVSLLKRVCSLRTRRVRAYGSAWAFTDIAYTDDCLVNTSALDRTLDEIYPDPTCKGEADTALFHVEAGITLHNLARRLDGEGSDVPPRSRWALPTMPGGDGQSLAGAMSTGVHGADLHVPPIADHIAAVHVISAGGREHWIESGELHTDKNRLQKAYPDITVHTDTDLLRAVTVGLGCPGVIYSAVIRAVPQFGLELTRRTTTWEAVREDLARLIDTPGQRWLQVLVNPYRGADGTRRCWVTSQRQVDPVRRRRAPDLSRLLEFSALSGPTSAAAGALLAAALTRPSRSRSRGALAEAAAWLALASTRLTSTSIGDLVVAVCDWAAEHGRSDLVAALSELALGSQQRPTGDHPRIDVSYRNMISGAGGAPAAGWYRVVSSEFFLSAVDPDGFVDGFESAVLSAVDAHIAAGRTVLGYLSLRFTPGSLSPLAMQRWTRSGSIEMPLLKGARGNHELLHSIQEAIIKAGGTMHWGQYHSLSPDDVRQMYPRLDEWRGCLETILDGSKTFTNAMTERLQL